MTSRTGHAGHSEAVRAAMDADLGDVAALDDTHDHVLVARARSRTGCVFHYPTPADADVPRCGRGSALQHRDPDRLPDAYRPCRVCEGHHGGGGSGTNAATLLRDATPADLGLGGDSA